jgi:hypothetical protein
VISVAVKVTNRIEAAVKKMDRAARSGMDAAAQVYEREVERAHGDHYTTQQYRGTLNVKQSIRRTRPVRGPNGYESEVGTKLPQPLYWELGWQTKGKKSRLMRRRIWVPTAIAQAQAIAAEYAKVVARMMNNA